MSLLLLLSVLAMTPAEARPVPSVDACLAWSIDDWRKSEGFDSMGHGMRVSGLMTKQFDRLLADGLKPSAALAEQRRVVSASTEYVAHGEAAERLACLTFYPLPLTRVIPAPTPPVDPGRPVQSR